MSVPRLRGPPRGDRPPDSLVEARTPRAFPAFLAHLTHATVRFLLNHAAENGPGWIRTSDLGIKSPLLYQLSYRPRDASVAREGSYPCPAWPPSTSGPGHGPFKAVARVRIPLGALGRLAQLGERLPYKREVTGSSPVPHIRQAGLVHNGFSRGAILGRPRCHELARLTGPSTPQARVAKPRRPASIRAESSPRRRARTSPSRPRTPGAASGR